jgi:hypothetical protein
MNNFKLNPKLININNTNIYKSELGFNIYNNNFKLEYYRRLNKNYITYNNFITSIANIIIDYKIFYNYNNVMYIKNINDFNLINYKLKNTKNNKLIIINKIKKRNTIKSDNIIYYIDSSNNNFIEPNFDNYKDKNISTVYIDSIYEINLLYIYRFYSLKTIYYMHITFKYIYEIISGKISKSKFVISLILKIFQHLIFVHC